MIRPTAILAVMLAVLAQTAARADSVVTVCTSDRGGGGTNLADAIRAGGLITFNCKGDATIQMSASHPITRNVRIDGGARVTLLEGKEPMFTADVQAASLELSNLRFRDTKLAIVDHSINGAITVTVKGSIFTNCDAPFRSLGSGPLFIRESVFTNCVGHVVTTADNLTIERSKFEGTRNDNDRRVQAVFSAGNNVKVVDSIFAGNRGGAMLIGVGSAGDDNHRIEIVRTLFENNGADDPRAQGNQVGAITLLCSDKAPNCTISISSSRFLKNTADNGAALFVSGAALVAIRNGRFIGNVAKEDGGAIFFSQRSAAAVAAPKLLIQHSVFEGNRAVLGGAIRMSEARLEGRAVTFVKNQASRIGGAIFVAETSEFSTTGAGGNKAAAHISLGVFVDNVAGEVAGAAWVFGGAQSVLANTLIARNRSAGGAFAGEHTRFVNSTIMDNANFGIRLPSASGDRRILFRNTIVASNGRNCALIVGAAAGAVAPQDVVDEGNNLEFPANSCGSPIPIAHPRLNRFYLPVVGSPAMGKGDLPTCLDSPVSARDVYGKRRPQGISCSIGAAEGDLEQDILAAGATIPGGGAGAGSKPQGPGTGGAQGPHPGDGQHPGTDSCCCCCLGNCRR